MSDYKAGELEGFKAGLAKRDEQIKTGTLPAGLGDRQLTDEILKVAHDRRFSNEFLGNLVRAWLASGENPEPYQCDECRCPPNCACCDAKRGCTCKDEPVGGGPFGA